MYGIYDTSHSIFLLNLLISNVSQGKGPKVSICDFGLSDFPTSKKEFGGRGTHLFKAKSFFLRCKDWQQASLFQLEMTSIFIRVGASVRKALTCSQSKCYELHDLEAFLKRKQKLSTNNKTNLSFLQLLQDFKIKRRPVKSCPRQMAKREGKNSLQRRRDAYNQLVDCLKQSSSSLDRFIVTDIK